MSDSTASYPGNHGDAINAYVAQPNAPGPYPAIVVVHGATGLSDDMKEVARDLAAEGYLAAVPDLYSRVPSPDLSSLASAMKLLGAMADSQVVADLDGCASYLKAHASCNGNVGAFGLGGRYTYLFACGSANLSAAAVCTGPVMPTEIDTPELRPAAPIDVIGKLACPLLGVFGDDDGNPTPEEVGKLEEQLKLHNKEYSIRRYPGAGHLFMNKGGRNYQPEAAAAAWGEALAWFGRYLR